ncbi:lipoprotein [Vibrio algivorus]|uniref:Type IV secretion system putative lipoprotein virB7 n=1 Tax=Vibrio algivorus TaxID=1667024 RepID=A0A557PFJ7_9VIBR|nr:lipoprotein [Vibrio algivorus]TVO39437.1 hypothetical protein FOF44_02295 [Vibrio algivorus]
MNKSFLVLGLTLALTACGGGGDDSSAPTPIPPDHGGDITPDNLLDECERSGCTLDEAVTTSSLTISSAPITLTDNASITLESPL